MMRSPLCAAARASSMVRYFRGTARSRASADDDAAATRIGTTTARTLIEPIALLLTRNAEKLPPIGGPSRAPRPFEARPVPEGLKARLAPVIVRVLLAAAPLRAEDAPWTADRPGQASSMRLQPPVAALA